MSPRGGAIHTGCPRYSHAIVWTPLPVITALCPLIGHVGICDLQGVTYDFAGANHVSINNFSFGSPTKYTILPIHMPTSSWDDGVKDATHNFDQRSHNLLSNNCHHFVADALNHMRYDARTDWTAWDVFYLITFKSEYTNIKGFYRQWVPFFVIVIMVIILAICFS